MSSYAFSNSERMAIYTVHNEKCYLCSKPVDLASMQVDHIIPETLLSKRDELDVVLKALALPAGFDLNDYPNWLPSCGPCNRTKGSETFTIESIMTFQLKKAAKKAEKTRAKAQSIVSKQKIMNAGFTILQACENGSVPDESKSTLNEVAIAIEALREPEERGKPVHLTMGYEVLLEKDGITMIRGPYGVGGRPSGYADASFNCPNCGPLGAWSGARCVRCGEMSED